LEEKLVVNEVDLSKIEDIINYHDMLFGVKEDIQDTLYLNIKQEMFSMINLFSLLDENFQEYSLTLLIKDILSLIVYFDTLDNKIKEPKNSKYLEEYKEFRTKIIPIINTKMYYLDLYVWKLVDISRPIQFYIRQRYKMPIRHTFDFLTYREKSFSPLIDINYKISDIDLKVHYENSDAEYILSLDMFIERRKNTVLRKLIDSKNCISFFKNMEATDIKYVVKDVEFLRYGRGETIIKQGEDSKEVYFILSGQCLAFVNSKNVGRLEKNQIFGEFSSVLNEPRTASVVAQDACTVLRFKFAFELFPIEPHPFTMLYKNIIDELIKKIVKLNKKR